ncbi:MAG: hypothetical protein MJZ22_00410 [Candidatus Saccharibacteria bacterium]|nr:hypothetical protein [Candidatus Saccharibacteria bacterium]
MADIDLLEERYRKEMGYGFDFVDYLSVSKIDVPWLMLLFDNNCYDVEETITDVCKILQVAVDNSNMKLQGLRRFLLFYRAYHFDPKYFDFIKLAAKIYVENEILTKEFQNGTIPQLLTCSNDDTLFVDLVSGYNFSFFFPQLDKRKKYVLVDKSPFTCHLLKMKAEKYNLKNVEIWEKDVSLLKKSDFSKNIEILRIKNGRRYIPNFLDNIDFYQNLIIPGGKMYVQESSSVRKSSVDYFNNLLKHFGS